jgi:hypothetical protein
MHAQNTQKISALDQISSGKQYKEPVKSTAHSSQQTQGDCTSTNLLEDETSQYSKQRPVSARYCCSVRADQLLACGSTQHALAPPLTRTPSALPLKPRRN